MISWKVEKSLKSIVVLHPRKIDFLELSLEQLFPIIQQLDIPQRLLDLNSRRKGACASIEFTSCLSSLSLFQMKDKKWTADDEVAVPLFFPFIFISLLRRRSKSGTSWQVDRIDPSIEKQLSHTHRTVWLTFFVGCYLHSVWFVFPGRHFSIL